MRAEFRTNQGRTKRCRDGWWGKGVLSDPWLMRSGWSNMALANFIRGSFSPEAINSRPPVLISPPLLSYLLFEQPVFSLLPLFSLCLSVCLSHLSPTHSPTPVQLSFPSSFMPMLNPLLMRRIFMCSSDIQLRLETFSPYPLLLFPTPSLSFLPPPDSFPFYFLFTFTHSSVLPEEERDQGTASPGAPWCLLLPRPTAHRVFSFFFTPGP